MGNLGPSRACVIVYSDDEKLGHAFVNSRLDYCNFLFYWAVLWEACGLQPSCWWCCSWVFPQRHELQTGVGQRENTLKKISISTYLLILTQINGWNSISLHDKFRGKSSCFLNQIWEWGRVASQHLSLLGEDTAVPRSCEKTRENGLIRHAC